MRMMCIVLYKYKALHEVQKGSVNRSNVSVESESGRCQGKVGAAVHCGGKGMFCVAAVARLYGVVVGMATRGLRMLRAGCPKAG